ncbi:MAG: Fe-S cluster assembly protein SufD [Gammaproteobacteria bacterium]
MSSATAASKTAPAALPDWVGEAAAVPAEYAPWLTERRAEALDAFRDAGFPARRDEAWKYTSLRNVERRRFAAPAVPQAIPGSVPGVDGLEGATLVFVNGRLVSADGLPTRATACSLAEAVAAGHPACEPLLGRLADPRRHRFAALGLACFTDGALLDVPADCELDEPVRLVFIADGARQATFSAPRVLIRAGANSRATVVEHYAGGSGEALACATTEIALAPGAAVEHYRLQEESPEAFHLGVLAARLEADARLTSHNIAVGGRIARLDLDTTLAGRGAEVVMNGVYLARDRQHVDNHTSVDHAVPHTRSDQIYRGVLDGRGRAVFNGRALVRQGAAGTDAQQANANLLLSEEAEVDTKPELEIYADDVKCSHGATTGQLDETALFYLRSRGVDEATARTLLTFAFCDVVLARMGAGPLRRHAERLAVGRLPDSDTLRQFT